MRNQNSHAGELTVVFDKSMNSEGSIASVDAMPGVHFITSHSPYQADDLIRERGFWSSSRPIRRSVSCYEKRCRLKAAINCSCRFCLYSLPSPSFFRSGFNVEQQLRFDTIFLKSEDFSSFESISSISNEQQADSPPNIFLKKLVFFLYFINFPLFD
ncbi:hypothetical protein Sfum_3860 [Syntrophobacter fumaroxidans MPOB]|uniref:Uncharacterized protein n=1 Tax=Syntrophobacter fumaroxidans (strain DSM 10017 / MPOB) TaxID=335543 RepID=A0LQ27_SYNFM|nr:hypothetical protein Sfum_3860 [Syntrophobacter fumaroxidans MPOB]